MHITSRIHMAGFTALALIAMLPAAPAVGDSTEVSRGVCTTIREENCTIDARRRAISILETDLRGKKNAKAVARLIGRPICNRIVNTFVYTPLRPVLSDWRMTLHDRRGKKPLYACNLF